MTAGSVAPDADADEHLGLNERLAAFVTRKVGSMWSVYITIAVMVGWIVLATIGPLNKSDPYPSPVLLFLGNLVQLLLVFVISVGQVVLGRTADRRSEETCHASRSRTARRQGPRARCVRTPFRLRS